MAIRHADPGDAAAITAIYAHHVPHGTATFDTVAPLIDDTAVKLADFAAKAWPFLVAEIDGVVVGYAYAAQFRDRPAYAFACENSIYLHPDYLGQGLGTETANRAASRRSSRRFSPDDRGDRRRRGVFDRAPCASGLSACRADAIGRAQVRAMAGYGVYADRAGFG